MTRIMTHPLFIIKNLFALTAVLLAMLSGLSACSTTAPEGMTSVTPFDIYRYQGKWYEIARMDHSFERGLSNVTANYRLQPDGGVEVINRGYDGSRNEWREVKGRALFIGNTNRASLKVSFFGPFYAGYHVIALDQQHYRWAMVIGPSRDYFWILAREKQLPAKIQEQLLEQARGLGIDARKLIQVDQTRNEE
jgi:apolipoprotein D and lipocalin family protein